VNVPFAFLVNRQGKSVRYTGAERRNAHLMTLMIHWTDWTELVTWALTTEGFVLTNAYAPVPIDLVIPSPEISHCRAISM
jgi:hypothetical protein